MFRISSLRLLAPLLGALATVGLLSSSPAAAGGMSFFGPREVAFTDFSSFGQWTRLLDRVSLTTPDAPGCGAEPAFCATENIAAFVAAHAGSDLPAQIEAVHAFVTRVPYLSDRENYGRGDYWATPAEFFARGGDCEDYAIASYFLLRALGVPVEDMRIVVLDDELRHVPHAIVVVRHENRVLALDNLLDAVTDVRDLPGYNPLYSINEKRWWYPLA